MLKFTKLIGKARCFGSSRPSFGGRGMCTVSLPNNGLTPSHINVSREYLPSNGFKRPNWGSCFLKGYSTTSDGDAGVIIESGREFDEIRELSNLSQFTANFWRSLRVSKPLLLTFNVSKAAESRMMDAVMGSGAFCKSLGSLDRLFETILQYKETKDSIGCYMNLDNNYEAFLTINKDLFEKIRLSCNSLFLDVTYPYQQSVDEFMKISRIISLVNPHVVRFCNGTLKFLLNTDLECPLLKENATNEDFSMERCYYISEKYNMAVIDSSEKIVVSNHSNMEIVVFPRLPQILNRIHGYNNCSGGIIASMCTLSSGDFLVPATAAISGLDFVSVESAKKSNGPASMLSNFVDNVYTLSMSPDDILDHEAHAKFYKRK